VVWTVLGCRRPPDAGQQTVLVACIAKLDRAWSAVPTEAQPYFQRLRDMADLTLHIAGCRGATAADCRYRSVG